MTSSTEAIPAPADVEGLVASLLTPGGIRTVFQPVVRVADGAVIGYEALSRSAAVPGMSPAAWLEAAEACHKRAEVELACIAAVADAGDPPDRSLLFLNASPDVALDPRFLELSRSLPRHVIEVTEHVAVEDYEPLLDGLNQLRSHGALVAVDDVGAGYASMTHVLRLSPSFIKIDRSLVSGIHRDSRRRALVEALQAFASASGALTVAEGVETEAELRELASIGVDLAQGYLLARPGAPWAEVTSQARRVLAPDLAEDEISDPEALAAGLEAARDQVEACEVVSKYLAHQGGLLPSVYLERGGVLRCLSRRGQWLVMDGLRPGSGISGAAFAEGREILCADVSADPRYRLAVPGVSAELAVPLHVGGLAVGVLNVDSLAPISEAQADLVRRCAQLLEARLEALVGVGTRSAILHDLSRLAPTLAQADSAPGLRSATLAAVAELTGFDSGCVWTFPGGVPTVEVTHGPQCDALVDLGDEHVLEIRDLVADLSSCYSGGTDLSLAVPPTHVLREEGVRGTVLVPLRDGRELTDVLALTSTSTSFIAPDVVDAVEALCLQAGSRLAALRRVAELEGLVHRDALTGVGSRGLWNLVLEECRDPQGASDPLWLAVVDVDRFKQVNDTRGHLEGDEVLCTVAELLGSLRGWSVFRLGGDEFTMFGPRGAEVWPEGLASVVREAHEMLVPYGANLSVGAVRTVRRDLARSLEEADRVLYRRKRLGGGGLTVDWQVG